MYSVEAQCLEHFDGSTAIVLAARIHLETGLTPSNLARAWKQLRIRYPLIATRTKPLQPEDPIALFNMTYTSPASDSEADEWINQTLVQSWMPPNVSLQAFAADLASANLFPLSKGVYAAQLHYVKASSDEMLLGIVSAHHATDGMQSLYYLDELCKHLSAGSDIPEPSWGSEVKSLKPPLSIELGLRTPSNDVPTDLEQFVASRMELMAGVSASCENSGAFFSEMPTAQRTAAYKVVRSRSSTQTAPDTTKLSSQQRQHPKVDTDIQITRPHCD